MGVNPRLIGHVAGTQSRAFGPSARGGQSIPVQHPRLWRVSAVLLVLGWTGLLLLGLGWRAFVAADDLYCEHSTGDSNFGELSWSIVPPGPVCTWTTERNGFDERYGPTPVMSIWLLALLVIGGLVVWVTRRAWSRQTSVAASSPS